MNEQQPYMNEPRSMKIGEFISIGWEFTKKHLGFLISYLIIMFIISILFSGIAEALMNQGRNLLSVLMHLAGWVIGLFLQMGFYKSALLITSGVKPGFNQMYSNDKHFLSYLGSNILYTLMVGIGLLLLIVPGFYLAVRYLLFPFFVLDKDMGAIEALKAASNASEGHRGFLFLLLLVFILLNIGGALLFGVGLLFTVPITALALTAVYRRLTNTETEITVPVERE